MGVSLQRTNSAQRVGLERGRVPGQRHSADLGARPQRPPAPGGSRLSLEQSSCASRHPPRWLLRISPPVLLGVNGGIVSLCRLHASIKFSFVGRKWCTLHIRRLARVAGGILLMRTLVSFQPCRHVQAPTWGARPAAAPTAARWSAWAGCEAPPLRRRCRRSAALTSPCCQVDHAPPPASCDLAVGTRSQ